MVDLHVWQDGDLDEVEAVRDRIAGALGAIGSGTPVHRADVTITDDSGRAYHFTFRSAPGGGLVEEALYRNLHPMLAKRLNLERLCRFDITRLDSAEDVYLFHGVARDNPARRAAVRARRGP